MMNQDQAQVSGIAVVRVKGEIKRADGTVEPFEISGTAQLPEDPGENDEE